jgi:hypothetical protein
MRRIASFACAFTILLSAPAFAQEPPPRIGPFVVDLHGTVPRFPEDVNLAASRPGPSGELGLADLPGSGLGVQIGLHIYLVKWRAVTFGIGGEFTSGRSTQTPPEGSTSGVATTERFRSLAPQLSFNFGNGNGWSYISGGIGQSVWFLEAAGQDARPPDEEYLKTINYGGGARWFAKPHVAFSFDVRLYAINPGTPYLGFPGSPRTTLVVIGAGVSVK